MNNLSIRDYGHQTNLCYVSQNNAIKLAYIPIHKNASTWTIKYLEKMEWRQDNACSLSLEYIFLVALRTDVISRWVSGICEVICKFPKDSISYLMYDDKFIDDIFTHITFESHTDLQTNFLNSELYSRTVFFELGKNYKTNFVKFLKTYNVAGTMPDKCHENRSYMFSHKTFIHSTLSKYSKIPKYNSALNKHFSNDFLFLDLVHFYS